MHKRKAVLAKDKENVGTVSITNSFWAFLQECYVSLLDMLNCPQQKNGGVYSTLCKISLNILTHMYEITQQRFPF